MKITGMCKRALAFFLGALVVSFAWICTSQLMPVGKVNEKVIRRYEVSKYINASSGNAVKNYAKDQAFFRAMKELGISVSEKAVDAEFETYAEKYGGEAEMQNVLLDTSQDADSIKSSIRKSLLYQKAIDYFASKTVPEEDEIKLYYAEHKESYPEGAEVAKDRITADLKAQIGLSEYQKYMDTVEKSVAVTVY